MTDELLKTSDLLLKLKEHKGEHIKVGEVVEGFAEAGFTILLIIFALPVALPLPALGIASILVIPVVILAAQLAIGRRSPWLPSKISNKQISMAFLNKVVDKAVPFFQKIEIFLKPRLRLFSTSVGERFVGVCCLICSMSVLLPLPFTNTVPSMGIVAMAIGLMERDGLAIIGGICIGIIGLTITCGIIFLGEEAVRALIGTIKDFII